MTVRILRGDCREVLKTLPDESVQCVVTSPPYYGLRDYGTAQWDGGDPACDHGITVVGGPKQTVGVGMNGHASAENSLRRQECRCGARRVDRQLGLEDTPDAYISGMVSVFREVRRVLRPDGTLWLNIGDSYAGSWGNQGRKPERGEQRPINGPLLQRVDDDRYPSSGSNTGKCPLGVKPKDLMMIPARLALALQADGWWIRSDIIWAKRNCMPESVRDRPTRAHEYIFLLTKSERYYYDAAAIEEDGEIPAGTRAAKGSVERAEHANGRPPEYAIYTGKRNKRSVWWVATQPFPEAHFATFPPDLIEPCILAGAGKGDMVLDPFGGAGTTGLVADRLGRNATLIELNPSYCTMAENRIRDDAGLFAEVAD